MTTSSSLLTDIRRELDALETQSRLRRLRSTTPLAGPYIEVDGRRMLDLSSNDYLGLASDSAALAAFCESAAAHPELARASGGATASRLLSGNRAVCGELEAALGSAYGRSALVFNSGYHANIGVLPALAGREDLVLLDRLCHASIIDGVRLSGANWRRYRHGDMAHLEQLLQEKGSEARRIFIVSESVFSMDGDCIDVAALVDVKTRYGATLILDEAHAVGVLGSRGLGAAETAAVLDRVDILVGTLGKAYGSMGAFVVAEKDICSYLVNRARSFIFSTGLPPSVHAWSLLAFRRALAAEEDRSHLAALAERFRDALTGAGLETYGNSQIVPVILGSDAAAVAAAEALQTEGYWSLPIRPPTVPRNTARLRFSLCANMTWNDLEGVIPVLQKAVAT
jgi:8-amino-7-oxononanoate synthase